MRDPNVWEMAVNAAREPLPMEPEIWAAGADPETAHFVARMLRERGYYLVRPDDIGWPEIDRFRATLHHGQSIYEDGGQFMARCIKVLLGIKAGSSTYPIVTYQNAARKMLEGME